MQFNMGKKIGIAIASAVTTAAVAAAVTLGVPGIVSAQTATPATPPASSTQNANPQSGTVQPKTDSRASYLAQALGISVADLQAAQTKAYNAEIDAALKAGTITQAQADALKSGTSRQRLDLGISAADAQKYLADALGKSVADLQAAETSAYKAELAAAVAAGRMTQAQADNALARQAFAKYIADQGLFAKAVQGAVSAGVITQAQANTILSEANRAGGGFGLFGGAGDFGKGLGGPGDFGGGPGGHGRGGGRGNLGGAGNGAVPGTVPGTTTAPNS